MIKVHYIGYYSDADDDRDLYSSPAACAKMDYIRSALKRIGCQVRLLSTSWTRKNGGSFGRKVVRTDSMDEIIYISTFGATNKLFRFMARFWSMLQLTWYLVTEVRTNEIVIVYHSISYREPIAIARRLRKLKLILQVEEIYSEVFGYTGTKRRREWSLISEADAYICASDFLKSRLEKTYGRKCIVAYGDYSIPTRRSKRQEENIHVVYAGVIDTIKKGAFNAAKCIQYLPPHYRVHILGFGADNHISELTNLIHSINLELPEARIFFHGLLRGESFSDFLHSAHIGVNSHTMEGKYADFTFPSKLLVYLAHNMNVVSAAVPCVMGSSFAKYISFYCDDEARSLAEAILAVDVDSLRDNVFIIRQLDADFLNKLREVLHSFNASIQH